MKTKRVHEVSNWSQLDGHLLFADAPRDQSGAIYPPIEWAIITHARSAMPRTVVATPLPRVWLSHNTHQVVGFVWELCSRYAHGEIAALYSPEVYRPKENDVTAASRAEKFYIVQDLVCAVHQHLGPLYEDFVSE